MSSTTAAAAAAPIVPSLNGLAAVRFPSPLAGATVASSPPSSPGRALTPGRGGTPTRTKLRPPSERSSPRGRLENEWDLVLGTIAISHPDLLEAAEAEHWLCRREAVLALVRDMGCGIVRPESLDCLALYALQGCKSPVTDDRLAHRMVQLLTSREPVVVARKRLGSSPRPVAAVSAEARSEWTRFVEAMSKLGLSAAAVADMA